MPQTDLLQTLLAHDRWATLQLLDACATLTPDQLHRRFDIGPGSLHDTLTHIAGAVRTWTDTLAAADPRPRPESDGQRRSVDQLRHLLDESYAQLAAEAHRLPPAEMTERRLRDGRTVSMTRAAVLAHVVTHAAHHRAQCLNILRQLNVTPLPPSSVAEWAMRADRPA